MTVAEVMRQVTVIANSNHTLTAQQVTLLKSLRDNVGLDYNLREKASLLLEAKQIDGIRQNYLR